MNPREVFWGALLALIIVVALLILHRNGVL